jgi:hypothetical protein
MTRANPSLPQRLEEFAQRSRKRERAGAREYGVCTGNLIRYAHLRAMKQILPARSLRERDVQRVEMLRLSAEMNRRFTCFLAESPCISRFGRERQVGLRLPAQPLSTHSPRGKGLSSGCARFTAEFRPTSPARSAVADGRDGFAAK